jgi:hypothetical protein
VLAALVFAGEALVPPSSPQAATTTKRVTTPNGTRNLHPTERITA